MINLRELVKKNPNTFNAVVLGVIFLLVITGAVLYLLIPSNKGKGTAPPPVIDEAKTQEKQASKRYTFESKKTDNTTWLMTPKSYPGDLETIIKTPDAVYLAPEKAQFKSLIENAGLKVAVCKMVRNEAFKDYTFNRYMVPIKTFFDNPVADSIGKAAEGPTAILSITDNWEISLIPEDKLTPVLKYQGVIKDKTSFQILNSEGREVSAGSVTNGVLAHDQDASELEYVSKAFLALALANEKIVI